MLVKEIKAIQGLLDPDLVAFAAKNKYLLKTDKFLTHERKSVMIDELEIAHKELEKRGLKKKKTAAPQKIKESISEKEYKLLISSVKGNDDLRPKTKQRALQVFTLLYYTGMRISELMQFKYEDIKKLMDEQGGIVYLQKTNSERKIHFSDQAIKDLKKVFDFGVDQQDHFLMISKSNAPTISPSLAAFTDAINKIMQNVLGSRYSSHSFRQGLITEMSNRGVNPKITQKFIGHKSMTTTMGYYKPSDDDVKGALVR